MTESVFLRLTDYVPSSDLVRLSAETLHGIVCGPHGHNLADLQFASGAELIEFVPSGPGFRLVAPNAESLSVGVDLLKRIFTSIKRAANVRPKQTRGSYHPLFTRPQAKKQSVFDDGLLPVPISGDLSPAECLAIISSPYLRRLGKPLSFEAELADVLPGVPGARQSKEYKRLRRKISEIDELMNSGTILDVCQTNKVRRRPDIIGEIRKLLQAAPKPTECTQSNDAPFCHLSREDSSCMLVESTDSNSTRSASTLSDFTAPPLSKACSKTKRAKATHRMPVVKASPKVETERISVTTPVMIRRPILSKYIENAVDCLAHFFIGTHHTPTHF